MIKATNLRRSLNCITLLALVVMPAWGANANQSKLNKAKPRVFDVRLAGQQLVGHVVSPQGTPKSGATVVVYQKDRRIAKAVTDKKGRFAVRNLRGGSYRLVTRNGQTMVRVWTTDKAPPSTTNRVIVVDGSAVRGQSNGTNSGSGTGTGPNTTTMNTSVAGPGAGAGAGAGSATSTAAATSATSSATAIGVGAAAAAATPVVIEELDLDDAS